MKGVMCAVRHASLCALAFSCITVPLALQAAVATGEWADPRRKRRKSEPVPERTR
jgi:hypothetical protein